MEKAKKIFKAAGEIFTGNLEKKRTIGLMIYFAVISILEILAYRKNGIFSVLASRLWLGTALVLLLLFLCLTAQSIVEDLKNKVYLLPVGFCFIFLLFCYYIGNMGYSDVNADAAQQAAAGVSSFGEADLNYTGVAFLGYANRQYIIAALPTLLFGRSIFSMQFGFAYPFLIGMTLLFLELRAWLKKEGMNEAFALVPIFVLPCFRFITEYYMNFEQAITPVAITMLGIALFLRLCRKQDLLTSIALAWVGCFACDSYTPGLAALGLLLSFLGLYLIGTVYRNVKAFLTEKKTGQWYEAVSVFGVILNILLFFIATMIGKRADRIESFREEVSLTKFAMESWTEFFTDENAVFLGIFSGIILMYLFLSLLGRLKFADFTISCWVLGVVFFANYMVGYTSYEKAWILQRNMIVIPVLITSIFLAVMRVIKKNKITGRRSVFVAVLLFFFLTGVNNFKKEHQSFNYFRYIQPMKYALECAQETVKERGLEPEDTFNLILFTDNLLQSNIYDYAKYLFPNANAISFSTDSFPELLDYSIPTVYISESETLRMFAGDRLCEKNFKNKRYHFEGTWYFYWE